MRKSGEIPAAIWLLIVVSPVAVAVMIGAAGHDRDGVWGQTTAAWLQALGSILAILASFMVASVQFRRAEMDRRRERSDAAQAVVVLVHKALGQVADRLMVAARAFSKRTHGMALREHRTTDLIEAIRQIDVGRLPPELVVPLSTLRSSLYAVNARITDIYRSEEQKGISEDRRERRIRSGLLVYDEAASDYAELCRILEAQHQVKAPPHLEPGQLREFVEAARGIVEERTAAPPGEVSPPAAPAIPPAT